MKLTGGNLIKVEIKLDEKRTIGRGAVGFPLGICIGYVITIAVSLTFRDGKLHPVVPALINRFGSEIVAVVFQAVLSGILGAALAAASVVWEIEKWSIVKQTGVYFLVSSMAMLPVAYFAQWMPHSVIGFFLYFGSFAAVFFVIWIVQYLIWKNKIQRMNKNIEKK